MDTQASLTQGPILEAQQRYFSYSVMLLAIVPQKNYFVLCFMAYRTAIARYVAKWGIAQMCLCETKNQRGGYRTILWECSAPLQKYCATWCIAAIVSQYRATKGPMEGHLNFAVHRCPRDLKEQAVTVAIRWALRISSKNKTVTFMILNPPEQTAEIWFWGTRERRRP